MRKVKGINTDAFMESLWMCLARDFKSAGYIESYNPDLQTIREGWKMDFGLRVNEFKAQYQLSTLFKRYRFENDAFTDEQLEDNTNEKFIKNQERVASLQLPSSLHMHLLLQKVRIFIKNVLGKYDAGEHATLCRFGKRASVGVPYRRSYLDVKLESPISGSSSHINWFSNQLDQDYLLDRAVKECRKKTLPLYRM